jgi:O-antigen/teichoic acid export membrane protein
LFALDRPRLPLAASAIPVLCNLALLLGMRTPQPQFIGLGASLGFLCAFAVLFAVAHAKRRQWLAES